MEAEFASWQANVGVDAKSLESALKPVERYALKLRTSIDPYYSLFFLSEQQRLESLNTGDTDEMWNVEEIEREKEEEEFRALNEGEMLATSLTADEVRKFKGWYARERKKRVKFRQRRILTGASWALLTDTATGGQYWFNSDTREVRYTIPKVIADKEAMELAKQKGYSGAPRKVLTTILSYLKPYPDRLRVSGVCRSWTAAARDECFNLRVLAVESGAREEDAAVIHARYGRNAYVSIKDAISAALPGDTIRLDTGHHWEVSLELKKPLRFIGQPDDNSRCVVELTGCVRILAPAVHVRWEGITFRRPRKLPKSTACMAVLGKVKLSLMNCVVNNDGASGSCIMAGGNCKLQILGCTIRGGERAGITAIACTVLAKLSHIQDNAGYGLLGLEVHGFLFQCHIARCHLKALSVIGQSVVCINACEIGDTAKGSSAAIEAEEECALIASVNCKADQATQIKLAQWNKIIAMKCNRNAPPTRGVVVSVPTATTAGLLPMASSAVHSTAAASTTAVANLPSSPRAPVAPGFSIVAPTPLTDRL